MKTKIYITIILFCVFLIKNYSQTTTTLSQGDDLIQAVADATDGDIIELEPGFYKANRSAVLINNKSLTIKATDDASEKPKVYINKIELDSTLVNSLTIEGIDFSGYEIDSTTGAELDTLNNDYFINLASGLQQFGTITVRNCIIRNIYRAVLRADRSTYTGTGFVFDNCIIYDIRDAEDNNYGPFRLNKNIQFTSFTLTNSTIYNVVNRIMDCENLEGFHQDILIDNCTFYNFGGKADNRYLFDFKLNDDLNFIISDCIFGKTNTKAGDGVTDIVLNGFRFTKADDEGNQDPDNIELTTTAFTDEFVIHGGFMADYEWNRYEYNLEELDIDFADPDNGDFTLPDDSPALTMSADLGVIGDPRWGPQSTEKINISNKLKYETYPNPASSELFINNPSNSSIVNIVSTIGQTLLIVELNNGINTIDISNLNKGIYFIISEDGEYFNKLIIQ